MNKKNLGLLLILFMLTSQKIVYGQELDTICLPTQTVRILAASNEKLIFADSLNNINEEEIKLLREVIEEKQVQENLNEGLLSTLRNEVERLQRHRTILGVGLGVSLIAVLLLAL